MFREKIKWIDFQLKIIYLYEKLFNYDKEKLIYYFSTANISIKDYKQKKRTINNWLNMEKKITRPNKFKLELFNISEYRMPNGSILLPLDAFSLWSLEQFKKHIDEYLLIEQQNVSIQDRIKFIYYYDTDNERLNYYELSFPNIDAPNQIKIFNYKMLYRGKVEEYQGIFYITVKNEFEYIYYIFERFPIVFNKEFRVVGVSSSKDYSSLKPKAYIALLTSSKLSDKEEKIYAHKLNESNILLAKPFSSQNRETIDYLLENFNNKIEILYKELTSYDIYKEYENIYFTLALEEYKHFYTSISKHINNRESYFINNRKDVKEIIFKALSLEKEESIDILFTITNFNSFSYFIELIYKYRLTARYLFIITNSKYINKELMQKLFKMKNQGAEIKILEKTELHYIEAIIPNIEPTIFFQHFNNKNNLYVSKNRNKKIDIKEEYQELLKKSNSLEDFSSNFYNLDGKWYCYTFGSKEDNQNYKTIEFEIEYNKIKGKFSSGVYYGRVLKQEKMTMLIFEESIIKIENIFLKDSIFRVSIIGKELNIHNRDLLVFGLISKEKREKKEILYLLNNIHKKKDKTFRLKLSNEFDDILSIFKY